jgi:hypothetical protein
MSTPVFVPFYATNTGYRKRQRAPVDADVPQVFPNKQYNKILFIAGHSTVCEDKDGGCSALPVFQPPVDVLFTTRYGDLLGFYGLFYDVLRRFCTGLRLQPQPQFSLPTISTMLKNLNRQERPPTGLNGFFHNLNLRFHEQGSDTSNMFLFQPGEGFGTVEASGVYLISPENITGLLNTTPNVNIDSGCNLFSNPQLLHQLGIAQTTRQVFPINESNSVYGYANPSFVRTDTADLKAQRVELSYLLDKLATTDILQGALVVVASCRGFEGASSEEASANKSPRAGEFTDESDGERGGNKKRNGKKTGKKRTHKRKSREHVKNGRRQ